MAQAMAALRSAAVASAALSLRQPHLRRALPGLHQHISTERTFPTPKPGNCPVTMLPPKCLGWDASACAVTCKMLCGKCAVLEY